jgi:hypothetical protein
MKLSQEQFKISLVLRDKKSEKRKFSADNRYKDRPKDRFCNHAGTTDKFR